MLKDHIDVLEVWLYENFVGALAKHPERNSYAFRYSPAWVQSGYSISPLFVPLSNEVYTFDNLNPQTFHHLPGVFVDALPDYFGNQLLQKFYAENGVTPDQITPLDRLAYIADRAMGALEFRPSNPKPKADIPLRMSAIVKQARSAIVGDMNDSKSSQAVLRQILSVGVSAGGARPKAIVTINDATGEIYSGQYMKPGLTSWLLKFDGVGKDTGLGESQEYGKIEYAYYLMAKAAGVDMQECRIFEEGGRSHFMTKRFDRLDDMQKKVHFASLCGLSHVDFNNIGVNDYAQLFTLMNALGCTREEKTQAFLRMVFNYKAKNCDDHSKNHAFRLGGGELYNGLERGKWHLSPAFDVTFAFSSGSQWVNQHLMGVMGKFEDVTDKEFVSFANRFEIYYAKPMIKQATEAVQHWGDFAKEAGVSTGASNDIWEYLRRFNAW